MADEVKKEDQAASTGTEVKNDDAGASSADTGLDLADALAQALERETKVIEERDNYKAGMLKAKGKTSAGESAGDETKDSSATASAIEKLLLRNKELELAAANRSQTSTGGQGGSTETPFKVGDNMLSDAQLQDLKGRGWDDVKIARFKFNLQKNRT